MADPLDNIMWQALTGSQAHLAVGVGDARRYARGFSPLAGFADPDRPDLEALARCTAPGEQLYCSGWTGRAPPGWAIAQETTMFLMVWQGDSAPGDDAPDTMRLDARHGAAALGLAALTQPGPFGPRTLEMGDYFGCVAGGRLVAMAGERMQAGTLREISGVATHPDHQGQGHARRLVCRLLRLELQRGQVPFLHVMRDNVVARALYLRMGFRDHREVVVRVFARR